jgi:hypothetical protein
MTKSKMKGDILKNVNVQELYIQYFVENNFERADLFEALKANILIF